MVSRAVVVFATLLLALLVACHGEALPEDPRPSASAEAVVPSAAVSARIAFDPGPSATSAPAAAPGGLHGAGTVRDDPPILSRPGLPPEVVRRIVRQNLGRFRSCYEAALTTDPTVSGTIVARYVIGNDGAVGSSANAGSTAPDPALVACVLAGLRRLAFPSPSGGPLSVTQTFYFLPPTPSAPPAAP